MRFALILMQFLFGHKLCLSACGCHHTCECDIASVLNLGSKMAFDSNYFHESVNFVCLGDLKTHNLLC